MGGMLLSDLDAANDAARHWVLRQKPRALTRFLRSLVSPFGGGVGDEMARQLALLKLTELIFHRSDADALLADFEIRVKPGPKEGA